MSTAAPSPPAPAAPESETPMPRLRGDLEIVPGPPEPDGAPTYVIHDPLHGVYDKASWLQFEILKLLRRPTTVEAVARRLRERVTVPVDRAYVHALGEDLAAKGLAQFEPVKAVAALEAEAARRAARARAGAGPAAWFGRYLYWRVPLWRPDGFLADTAWAAALLGSAPARWGYWLLALIGLWLMLPRWSEYIHSLPPLTPGTVAAYALAVAVVKGLHELGHAYAAKARGLRVPTMGLAFILLAPIPYTDATDAWRLADRRARLAISAAGVRVELVVAGLSLALWGIAPPGLVRTVAAMLSSTSVLTSLAVNLNPAMRYDGYYVLSDLWGIDNLQPRAFAATRWLYRRLLFGIDAPCPEPTASARRLAALALYTLCAWSYRVLLYGGIAWIVYDQGRWFKALGVALGAATAALFFVRPVVVEGAAVLGSMGRWCPRAALPVLALVGGLYLFLTPTARREAIPATRAPAREQILYAPVAGRIRAVRAGPDATVAAGDPLVLLDAADARAALAVLEAEIEERTAAVEQAGQAAEGRAAATVSPARRASGGATLARASLEPTRLALATARAKADRLRAEIARAEVRARIDGRVVAWDPTLRPGRMLAAEAVVGRVLDPTPGRIRAYLPEHLAGRVAVGDRVYFADASQPTPRPARIRSVARMRQDGLLDPALAHTAGGPLPVETTPGGGLRLLEPRYLVEARLEVGDPSASSPGAHASALAAPAAPAVVSTLDLASEPLRFGAPGRLWVTTPPRSAARELWDWIRAALLRESAL